MSISLEIADELDMMLSSIAYEAVDRLYAERIEDWTRKILAGRMSHDEYQAACASIREAQYLRDRPKQLIQEARMTR